jgi:hypothetical protein
LDFSAVQLRGVASAQNGGAAMIKSWDTFEYTAAETFFSGEMKAKGIAPTAAAK